MKKVLFGIFAHPDDEAFGPCATLLLEARSGTDIHLITFTAGENGMNPDNLNDIGDVRLREWRAAGSQIGASTMHHLGYTDGTLDNNIHLEASKRLKKLLGSIIENYHEAIEVEVICMDLNGVSGHIDHIVATRSAYYAYQDLKAAGLPLKRMRLFCIPETYSSKNNTDYVFMEAGRPLSSISETIDGRSIADEVKSIMRIHHTQRDDAETHIAQHGDDVALDHFIITEE